MHLRIGKKLAVSFGSIIVLMIIVFMVTYGAFSQLRKLQDQGAVRANDAVLAVRAADAPYRIYSVIANAVINRDLDATERDWELIKTEEQRFLIDLGAKVDTDEERAHFKISVAAMSEIIDKFENQLIPLLRTTEEIRQLDAEIETIGFFKLPGAT